MLACRMHTRAAYGSKQVCSAALEGPDATCLGPFGYLAEVLALNVRLGIPQDMQASRPRHIQKNFQVDSDLGSQTSNILNTEVALLGRHGDSGYCLTILASVILGVPDIDTSSCMIYI